MQNSPDIFCFPHHSCCAWNSKELVSEQAHLVPTTMPMLKITRIWFFLWSLIFTHIWSVLCLRTFVPLKSVSFRSKILGLLMGLVLILLYEHELWLVSKVANSSFNLSCFCKNLLMRAALFTEPVRHVQELCVTVDPDWLRISHKVQTFRFLCHDMQESFSSTQKGASWWCKNTWAQNNVSTGQCLGGRVSWVWYKATLLSVSMP